MTKEIKTSITIEAKPEKVWQILTCQKEYPNWNPFIKKLSGNLSVGEKLDIIIQPKNSSKMSFKPTVLAFAKNKKLTWKGKLLIKGLFDGTHHFQLVDNKNGTTTFVQSELFNGVLVGLFNLKNTQLGFESMNAALKRRCQLHS